MSITIRSGRAPNSHARARARARAARNASNSSGSLASRSISRNAVVSDATGPNNGSWSRTARRSERQSPPSASITARSRITRPGSCLRRRSRRPASARESSRVKPVRSATSANNTAPACDTNPAPSGATSTVKQRPPRITRKVTLQARDQGPSASPRIPVTPDVQAPRPARGAGVNARSRLVGPCSPDACTGCLPPVNCNPGASSGAPTFLPSGHAATSRENSPRRTIRGNGSNSRKADMTLSEFVPMYLARHAVGVRPRTIATLRDRLQHATRAFGDVPLRELERMTNEVAAWRARLPERAGHGIAQAFRQVLDAAVRWEYVSRNPAKLAGPNRKPPARTVRAFTHAEIEAIGAELAPAYATLPVFAAATGLRPEEWSALERRDVDRRARIVTVARTVSDGTMVELGKTNGSLRQVPLSRRALEALDAIPPRLDTPLIFPAPRGGLLDLTASAAAPGRPPSRPGA